MSRGKDFISMYANPADLKRIDHKLEPGFLLNDPQTDMLISLGEAYLNEAKLRAPVDTGLMRSTLARGANGGIFDLDRAHPPLFIKVGTSHVSSYGFPYPKALDAGGDKLTYHYRGGGALGGAARGQPTKGWFGNIRGLASFVAKRAQIVQRAGARIRARWEGR
jgi:hypothetical protein